MYVCGCGGCGYVCGYGYGDDVCGLGCCVVIRYIVGLCLV